jgi:hypothetical protein
MQQTIKLNGFSKEENTALGKVLRADGRAKLNFSEAEQKWQKVLDALRHIGAVVKITVQEIILQTERAALTILGKVQDLFKTVFGFRIDVTVCMSQ